MNRYLYLMLGPIGGTLTILLLSGGLLAFTYLLGALGLLFALWLDDRS